MDGFGTHFFSDDLADLSLELQIDPADELLTMDTDPGFNNFLLELAEDPLSSFDNIPRQEAVSYDGSPQREAGNGGVDSNSSPRSPCSSGQESSPVVDAGALPSISAPTCNPASQGQRDRRAKPGESEEARALRVKERNRLYAARTRQRKNRLLQDLRQRCSDLESENSRLRNAVAEQQAELDMLRVLKCQKPSIVPQFATEVSDTHSGDGTPSPTPCTISQAPPSQPRASSFIPGSAVTAHVWTAQPSQKAKNKLRFTAAAPGAPAGQHTDHAQLSARGGQSRAEGQSGCTGSAKISEHGPMVVLSDSTKDTCSCMEAVSVETGKRLLEPEQSQSRRRVRGRISIPSKAIPKNIAALGILAVFAVSCLLLLAFPVMVSVFPSTTNDGTSTTSFQGASLPRTVRSLLEEEHSQNVATSLVPYHHAPVLSHDDRHEGISAASAIAQQVLQTAKFVCNHSSCVAVSSDGHWAHAVPQVPIRVRGEASVPGDSMQKTVLSALENVVPMSQPVLGESIGVDDKEKPHRAKHLRGVEEPVGVEAGESCVGDGCEYFKHSGHVLSTAGLLEPDVCTVVHRIKAGSQPESGGMNRSRAMKTSGRATGSGSWKKHLVGTGEVSVASTLDRSEEASISHLSTSLGSQDFVAGGSDATSGRLVSVLLPVWKLQAEEKGVMTPMMSIFVLVSEGEDLLTYECSLSRTLYV